MQSDTTLNDHERRVVAYHEAGHALCRELLPTTDRVHKISIVPRGHALGYVMNLPDEDSYLKTRDELVDQMTVLLGGRVAEAIVFGAVTTGAANDLQRVAEITHAMVHEYGMGTAHAGGARDHRRGHRLRPDAAHPRRGAAGARVRGPEGRLRPHQRAPPQARGASPQALLERETLERHEIDGIMAGVAPARPNRRGEGPIRLVASEAPAEDPAAG